MTLYVTEREMIQRYVDSLSSARSCALGMIRSPLAEQPKIFIEFIASLKRAAGSAHQLCFAQLDHSTSWLSLRDRLEKIIELSKQLPSFTQNNNGLWFNISQTLEALIALGQKLATQKAFSRNDILFDVDQRAKNPQGLEPANG